MRALIPVYQATESYWHRMLSSRSQKRYATWPEFQALKAALSFNASLAVHFLSGLAMLRDSVKLRAEELSAGNPHAGFRGGGATQGE